MVVMSRRVINAVGSFDPCFLGVVRLVDVLIFIDVVTLLLTPLR